MTGQEYAKVKVEQMYEFFSPETSRKMLETIVAIAYVAGKVDGANQVQEIFAPKKQVSA